MVCPKCKNDQARRSHRQTVWERLAGLLAIYPYRCPACAHRFLQFRFVESALPVRGSGAEREVRATTRAVRWRRKRRELVLYATGFMLFLLFLYYLTRPRDSGGESQEP